MTANSPLIFRFLDFGTLYSYFSILISLLEITSSVSLKNESLLFWTRVCSKGESQVFQNFEGVAHKNRWGRGGQGRGGSLTDL